VQRRHADPDAARAGFLKAAERWSLLVDAGTVNGPLLYDIGNAFVLAGDLGHGIASYLRAQQYMPNDPRLAENLAHARSLVSSRFDAPDGQALLDRLLGWIPTASPWATLFVFTLAWTGLWACLVFRRSMRTPVRRPILATCSVFTLVAGMAVISHMAVGSSRLGVLVEDGVVVRKGDAATFAPQFSEPIDRGVEFRILEERPVWLHVEFPNGDEGWVPRDAAEVVVSDQPPTARV